MDCVEANHSIGVQRDEFAIRLYHWAERDLQREIDADFPRVKRVKSSRAFHYLDFLRSLPIKDRYPAAMALFRASNAHRKTIESLGYKPTDFESSIVSKFRARFYPVAIRSDSEEKLLSRTPPGEFDIDPDELEELIRHQVSSVLGIPGMSEPACSFQQRLGPWYVRTFVDVHSILQLRYGHAITARGNYEVDLCPVSLVDHDISFLRWLGIHSDTSFERLRRSEISETAVLIGEVIHQFISDLPQLLDGLTHSIPERMDLSPQTQNKYNKRRSSRKRSN